MDYTNMLELVELLFSSLSYSYSYRIILLFYLDKTDIGVEFLQINSLVNFYYSSIKDGGKSGQLK